ncbi:sulfatase-like hydrolase/transferase [Acholeplasma sp. OttesenSCG-928-E16]|nr:sulfatase-like hydrolase/transferase [Acholeplasma sp. OttesenSCG-928-E16]
MKKNVLVLVCDGLTYNSVCSTAKRKSPMPFVESLRGEGIWCTNAYSQAPFTEGGIMGLLYGHNTLDNGSYLYRMLEWEDSLFSVFEKEGYDLFESLSCSFMPSELIQKSKFSYNINGSNPMFSRFILSKLNYYKKIFDNKQLISDDYYQLFVLLDKHFRAMRLYRSDVSLKNDVTGEYQPYEESETFYSKVNSWKHEVENQYASFLNDKKMYIDSIFLNYDSHFITKKCNINAPGFKPEIIELRKHIKQSYSGFLKRVLKKSKNYYLKRNMPPLSYSFSQFKKIFLFKQHKQGIEYFYRMHRTIHKFDVSKMLDIECQQICTSAKAYVRMFMDWEKRRDKKSPFFAYLHFDEFHTPLSFYSHDISNKENADGELIRASEFVNKIPKNYCGDLRFDLAARYLDECIKEVVDYLRNTKQEKNTILVITADHGSSNCGGVIRHTLTNNFFDEQYHIPVLLLGVQKKEISSYIDIKDIPYTILDECGINKPHSFTGQNIRKSTKSNTFVEYLGSGVPDMLRRPVLWNYRDKEKSFVISVMLTQDISDSVVIEYYDLLKDPNELKNINKDISFEQIESCKLHFKKRFIELKANYSRWLNEQKNRVF